MENSTEIKQRAYRLYNNNKLVECERLARKEMASGHFLSSYKLLLAKVIYK